MASRVAVTGAGPLSPIGTGKAAFWESLRAGESGVRRVDDRVDLTGIDVKIAAPVDNFDPHEYIDPKKARRLDRSTQLALAATSLALKDAGINTADVDLDRFGAVVGTGIGGLETFGENFTVMLERGPRRVSPFFVPRMMPNALAGEISIAHGLGGANFGVVSACASGNHAIGLAADLIASGVLERAVAGGAEAVLIPVTFAGFARMGALSKRNDEPKRASRPFDAERDGFVMGEGAGILILENYDLAVARGAHIYAEVSGFGLSADATHITAPAEDGSGASRAMQMAMDRAGVAASEIDYINAHGTSTIPNDRVETIAIKTTFGEDAKRVKISSTKSQVGHLLGAAGGIEAIATVLTMEHGFIPATLNYENLDPECDLDYTPTSVEMPVRVALSNSFGFGGQNASLIFVRE